MFADAIDIPYVIGFGLIVLAPLLLFEVGIEAFVLKNIWHIQFRKLCNFTFLANCLSLLAGIPVKIFNAWLYTFLLPGDLPGFFARYPAAVTIGSLIYFIVTLGVEGAYAFRWLRRKGISIVTAKVWSGIFFANLASYIVLAPLHYYLTRPIQQVREFIPNASWSSNSNAKVIFTDAADSNLKMMQLGGGQLETIVPMVVKDYLLSTNLNLCLFRNGSGELCLYRRDTAQTKVIWQTKERFLMNQGAFSPSGQYVAFASEDSNAIEIVNISTGRHGIYSMSKFYDFMVSIAWSPDEKTFYAKGFQKSGILKFTIGSGDQLSAAPLVDTPVPQLLPCYGRVSAGEAWYGEDWGAYFNRDSCGNFSAWVEPGLESGLRIYQNDNRQDPILNLSVNPGLLHIAHFYFEDVAFLPDCSECLFQANDYIYVLNIPEKKVGTIAHGTRFILLAPRYQKQL